MAQLRRREDDLRAADCEPVLVTFEKTSAAREYVEETGLDWPVLVDPELESYGAVGLGRAPWWKVFSPKTLWRYLTLVLRGRKPRKPGGDAQVMGGDVVVDAAGIVRWQWVCETPADRPSVDQVVAAVRDAAGQEDA